MTHNILTELGLDLLKICLILTVAAFGAVIVRNVTGILVTMTHPHTVVVLADRPAR